MFKWLRRMSAEQSGLGKMIGQFGRMVDDGRHAFDLACSAYLAGADTSVVHPELIETDNRINEMHRVIRRELVIHASLQGASDMPFSLVMMSIVKDAERIGDYAKNIYDLATYRPKAPGGAFHEHLMGLRSEISTALADARQLYESEDVKKAAAYIEHTEIVKDYCDDKIEEILTSTEERTVDPADPAATALCYRYFKRVISHARNIVTSVLVPVDQLDYFDEDYETRGEKPA